MTKFLISDANIYEPSTTQLTEGDDAGEVVKMATQNTCFKQNS